ncbi:MAG: hypothetical protein D6714_00100, partial [Bacteroidetes bacterium]
LFLSVQSCKNAGGDAVLSPENLPETLLAKLIDASEGAQILLPEGHFEFQRPLSLDGVNKVTIRGAGKGKTVLSFKNQIEGAEGMIVKNVTGLTLEGFTIADSKGDALKVQDCRNVIFRDLEATWTGGPKDTNGGYGLYPVSCENVLLEKCEASFASDAGIYVGQSKNIIVRDNYAHDNVAGIEIENSINGEVYRNKAENNSGGLLIFDMPDLPQANGEKISVFDNEVIQNNHPNFAAEGTVVALLPPGSGITVMAHRAVEIRNNHIKGHHTVGFGLNSWLLTGRPFESEAYDPFYAEIYVHDNHFEENTGQMDTTTAFGQLLTAICDGQTRDIAIDGIFHPKYLDENGHPTGICFHDNGEVSFVNFNGGMGGEVTQMLANRSFDIAPFECRSEPLRIEGHDAWLADAGAR